MRTRTGVDFLPVTKMEELEIVNESIKQIESQDVQEEETTAVKQQKLIIEVDSDDKDLCVASTEYFGKRYVSNINNPCSIEDSVNNLFLQIRNDLAKDEMEKTITFLLANKKNAENMAVNIHHMFAGESWFSVASLAKKLGVSEDDTKFKILFLKNYGFIQEEKTKTKTVRFKINYNDKLRKIYLENEISSMETNIELYKSQLSQINLG